MSRHLKAMLALVILGLAMYGLCARIYYLAADLGPKPRRIVVCIALMAAVFGVLAFARLDGAPG